MSEINTHLCNSNEEASLKSLFYNYSSKVKKKTQDNKVIDKAKATFLVVYTVKK